MTKDLIVDQQGPKTLKDHIKDKPDMVLFFLIFYGSFLVLSLILWAIKGFKVDGIFIFIGFLSIFATGAACLSYAYLLHKRQFQIFAVTGSILTLLTAIAVMANFTDVTFLEKHQGNVVFFMVIASVFMFYVSFVLHAYDILKIWILVPIILLAAFCAGYLFMDYVVNWAPGTENHKEFSPQMKQVFYYAAGTLFFVSVGLLIWGVIYYLFFKDRTGENVEVSGFIATLATVFSEVEKTHPGAEITVSVKGDCQKYRGPIKFQLVKFGKNKYQLVAMCKTKGSSSKKSE